MAFCETSKMFRPGFNRFMWEAFVFGASVVCDTSSLDSVSRGCGVALERERRLVRTTTRGCTVTPCFAGHRDQYADESHFLQEFSRTVDRFCDRQGITAARWLQHGCPARQGWAELLTGYLTLFITTTPTLSILNDDASRLVLSCFEH